jgi:hypothetical protein
MGSGGARNRSGPGMDPDSIRSEKRGVSFSSLPNEGFDGEAPEFPLPVSEDTAIAARELAVWAEAWSTPQAAAWAVQRWRLPVIAEYVRLKVLVERSSTPSMIGQLHRYRDQLGLTPAGLKENGWAIAATTAVLVPTDDEGGDEPAPEPESGSARSRLTVVPNAASG